MSLFAFLYTNWGHFDSQLIKTFSLLQPDPGAKQNLNPIYTAEPKFIKSVRNGKLYRAGEGEDAFDIVHLYGK